MWRTVNLSFNYSTPMVNGLDHTTPEYSSQYSNSIETATSSAPYAVAAAIVSSNTATNARAVSPTNKILTAEQNAVQVVRNHVESLKYPGGLHFLIFLFIYV